MKTALFLILLFPCFISRAQDSPVPYLSAHHYSFTLEKGFEGPLADTLLARLTPYRLILQAEGGSHFLTIYERLELDWLTFLHERMGMTHFIGELGVSNAVLVNKYLGTGDRALYPFHKITFLDGLRQYNQQLPSGQRLVLTGVDFERPSTYIRGLKLLLPGQPPQETISAAIELIRQAPDSGYDCDGTLRLNDRLKQALADHEQDFKAYLGSDYADFEKIVRSNGSCKDPLRNRNDHMAENFLALDREITAPVYYGEFGMAHTILKNHRLLASIINDSAPFKNKVAVINLYCYNCTTPEEGASNWALNGIEKDILHYFLPLCEGDFTLFDLSGSDPVVARYRVYGQFLIVAKEQH
jgi:hypothetical protein